MSVVNLFSNDDQHWMQLAIAQAATSVYITSSNPRVGCVIVRDHRLIGVGSTQALGGAHAEICALADAAQQAEETAGATFYVTLEPCSHYGRTPPCVDALIAAKPKRVVIAIEDPNPQVNSQGIAKLKAANIIVETGLCAEQALDLNIGFITRMQRGTPWAWLKMASSLDGRSALHNKVSQWITGPYSRADGHHWRARSGMVMTGIGTVLQDNPQLNVRHINHPCTIRKAIIDSEFKIPEDARLFDGSEILIFTARSHREKSTRLKQQNAQVIVLPTADATRVDLPAVMRWLGENQVNEVHVEAGAGLNGALLAAQCVDELLIYLAPMLLGDAISMAHLPALEQLQDAYLFNFTDITHLGEDIRLRLRKRAR